MRRSLKGILTRLDQLAPRIEAAAAGSQIDILTARLVEARRRCAAGMRPPVRTNEELRQLAEGTGFTALLARRQLRTREWQRQRRDMTPA